MINIHIQLPRKETTHHCNVTVDDSSNDNCWQRDSVCDLSQQAASASQRRRCHTIACEAVDNDGADGVEDGVGDLEGIEGLTMSCQ